MLQTNVPGMGTADIHSPERFLTFNNTKGISQLGEERKATLE